MVVIGSLEKNFLRFQQDGDGRALGKVFDACAGDLLRVARHLAPDAASADDLVQSTFLVAIESAEQYDGVRPLQPWLTGILIHRARNARRKAAQAPDPDRVNPTPPPSPDQSSLDAELEGCLRSALRELPSRYRDVLAPHLLEEASTNSIAKRLQRSPGTVRVQVHRGLQMLRNALPSGLALQGILGWNSADLAQMRARVLEAGRQAVPPAGLSPAATTTLLATSTRSLAVLAVLGSGILLTTLWNLPDSKASTVVLERTSAAEPLQEKVANTTPDVENAAVAKPERSGKKPESGGSVHSNPGKTKARLRFQLGPESPEIDIDQSLFTWKLLGPGIPSHQSGWFGGVNDRGQAVIDLAQLDMALVLHPLVEIHLDHPELVPQRRALFSYRTWRGWSQRHPDVHLGTLSLASPVRKVTGRIHEDDREVKGLRVRLVHRERGLIDEEIPGADGYFRFCLPEGEGFAIAVCAPDREISSLTLEDARTDAKSSLGVLDACGGQRQKIQVVFPEEWLHREGELLLTPKGVVAKVPGTDMVWTSAGLAWETRSFPIEAVDSWAPLCRLKGLDPERLYQLRHSALETSWNSPLQRKQSDVIYPLPITPVELTLAPTGDEDPQDYVVTLVQAGIEVDAEQTTERSVMLFPRSGNRAELRVWDEGRLVHEFRLEDLEPGEVRREHVALPPTDPSEEVARVPLDVDLSLRFQRGRTHQVERIHWKLLSDRSSEQPARGSARIHIQNGRPFLPSVPRGSLELWIQGTTDHSVALPLVLEAGPDSPRVRFDQSVGTRLYIYNPNEIRGLSYRITEEDGAPLRYRIAPVWTQRALQPESFESGPLGLSSPGPYSLPSTRHAWSKTPFSRRWKQKLFLELGERYRLPIHDVHGFAWVQVLPPELQSLPPEISPTR